MFLLPGLHIDNFLCPNDKFIEFNPSLIEGTINNGVIQTHRSLFSSRDSFEFLMEWNNGNLTWVPGAVLLRLKHPSLLQYIKHLMVNDDNDEFTDDINRFMKFKFDASVTTGWLSTSCSSAGELYVGKITSFKTPLLKFTLCSSILMLLLLTC